MLQYLVHVPGEACLHTRSQVNLPCCYVYQGCGKYQYHLQKQTALQRLHFLIIDLFFTQLNIIIIMFVVFYIFFCIYINVQLVIVIRLLLGVKVVDLLAFSSLARYDNSCKLHPKDTWLHYIYIYTSLFYSLNKQHLE